MTHEMARPRRRLRATIDRRRHATGILAWLTGRPTSAGARPPRPAADPEVAEFTCTTCGRTDLPPAGDWDAPICQECDAALNFDAILEHEWYEEQEADADG